MNSGVDRDREEHQELLGGVYAEKLVTWVDPKMRTHQAVHLRSVYFIVYISYLDLKRNERFIHRFHLEFQALRICI